ncbi:MAG: PQQ-binding-like beta-propeller repeat protein [Thaumarchaeota archaeon]|nr:PQQ-binding-like beta-propeller repeat protein [Nitrososphaerota archaeon]
MQQPVKPYGSTTLETRSTELRYIHALNFYRDKGWLIPSVFACMSYAVDAKTGKTAWFMNQEQVCGTNAEFGNTAAGIVGSLGNQGNLAGTAHPPQFIGNIMFIPMGAGSGGGGRAFVTAFDMSDPTNPKRLYREFVMPPAPNGDPDWAISECNRVNGNGWYFEYPRYLESINHPARDREPTYLATKCTDVPADVVKNDWIDMVPGSRTFGKLHTASAISPVWGTYPIDAETGLVYIGWGDQGPYTNLTHRYGPGLHGSGFTVHDIRTGKMVWWFQSNTRDIWDYDCSWSGIIGQVQGKKAFIKGCKNGIVYALDAATGKPFWVFDPPTILRNTGLNYGVDKNNDPRGKDACCRLTKEDMAKPWPHYPSKERILASCYTTCLESDIAYDGKRVYLGSYNAPVYHTVTNVIPRGNNGLGAIGAQVVEGVLNNTEMSRRLNSNVYAVDVNTGKQAWTYRIEQAAFRGGIAIAGGLLMVYVTDGNLRFIDTETGRQAHQMTFGIPVAVMPTVGATKEGKYQILVYVGGGGSQIGGPGGVFGATSADGALVAYGLPNQLPQPQVITKEVIKEVPKEVIKEVIKEVPKEVIKEVPKEVIKEVVKEVPKEVTVETISPISYAAIGIGVVLVVISGVLFSRRKKA